MNIELVKWSPARKRELIEICNAADRTFLSNRMPYPYTEAAADWWLDKVAGHDGRDGLFRAVAVDGRIVGNVTLEGKPDVYCRDGELGYLLMKEYWSRGIATEAVRQLCALAFDELDILRITALVYAPNTASRRVLEKNGFRLEGIQKNAVSKDGRVYDLLLYGKLREDG